MKSRREFLCSLGGACVAAVAGPGFAQDVAPRGTMVPVEEGGLAPRPAGWYKKLPEEWVQCGLCPRGCRISDAERGTCGVRENRKGNLYTLVHSRPCTVALDPIEKKPFFHVLPGSPVLSLATAGCNFDCKGCQNWEIAQARPEQVRSFTLTPEDAIGVARERGAPLVACTYTEPTVFSEYVLDIARAGRGKGIRTVVVSNGSIQQQPLADLCAELAAYKVDLKGFNETFYRQHTGGELKPVLETLRRLMKLGTWTEIVVLVIPTLNDSVEEIKSLARFVVNDLGPEVPVHFTRFHPAYRLMNLPSTPVSTLERARQTAMEQGLRFVYLGNVPGHPGENTLCPGCGRTLIKRRGMALLENNLKGGSCPDCRRKIPGVWV
ncbi:MAG: AmmeMemoRadiSam system radical SAM enzyme [Acidobacteria bacterium]|nr:AmmeMemoRadiSam system radical SAM enzyme [Acidobacteriota bacterium]MCK6681232.1 AmmeMemoRadiSam system radical SAM enzyme [Thermoanaerobaculia bacterium]